MEEYVSNDKRTYRPVQFSREEINVFCRRIIDISGVEWRDCQMCCREIFSIRIFFEAKKYSFRTNDAGATTGVRFPPRRISRWYCRYGCHGDRHRDNSLVPVAKKNPKSLNYQEPLSRLIKFRQSFHSDGFHGTGEGRGNERGMVIKGR